MENILLDQVLQQVQNREISIEKARDLICVLFNVSQQRELLIDFADAINIHDGDRVKIGKLVDLHLKAINCG